MKIEEVEKDIKGKYKKSKLPETYNYWFPLSKGYNRLLIVFFVVIIIFIALTVKDEDQIFVAAFFTLLIELGAYFSSVWIYRGFEESTKE